MIGGQDIEIPCADPEAALDLATRVVMQRWRHCVIEDGETGEVLPRYGQMEFGGLDALLISKTPEASALWDERGACEETRGTLVHLLRGKTMLTVVIDDQPTEEVREIVREIRSAVTRNLLARREAA